MMIYTLARVLHTTARDVTAKLRRGKRIGRAVWRATGPGDRPDEIVALALDGWPVCACTACGCSSPASTTDDSGVAVCAACSDYTVDDDGEVHCSQCDDVEVVTESCGAGGQLRSYVRMAPPAEPETDPDGTWACYWYTVDDHEHVVSRHTTRAEAEQACAAKDWPGPSDHTPYLCGYVVRYLDDDGRWARPD